MAKAKKTAKSVKSRTNAKRTAATKRKAPAKRKASAKRWSGRVMRTSNALDLEEGVFTKGSGREVAESLKRSAERSQRRKSDPYRSAMSMLIFHMNRAGRSLPAERKRVLTQAKAELRRLFGKST